MDEGKKERHKVQIVREQLRRVDFKEAFRSQYKLVPNEERFKDLLKRLEQAEISQAKR